MPQFDLLAPPYLVTSVATPVLSYLKKKYGSNGLKIESSFSDRVSWSPTIQLKSSATELTVVEVSEILYPAIFGTSYASILNDESSKLIKVFQACPLSAFQADKRGELVRKLKTHGFGLLTVDDTGFVDLQFQAAVLIHHIPDVKFESAVRGVSSDVRTPLGNAFEVYRTSARQGLQHAGQVVEALIHHIAEKSLTGYKSKDTAATLLDRLYQSSEPHLEAQRACFGGARQFMKLDRNSSSHPSKNKREAKNNSTAIREGFETALRVCVELDKTRKALKLKGKLSL